MSDQGLDRRVRAVDIGMLFRRSDGGIHSRAHLVGFAGFLLIGVIAWLVSWGPTRYLSAVPAVVGVGMLVRGHRSDGPTTPQFPGIDLRSFSDVDPAAAADHLVGSYEGPPGGLPNCAVVVARIDRDSANRLVEIPEECGRRWDESALQTILIGIPRAQSHTIAEASEAYDTTLLVDDESDIPTLLGYLADLLAQPEGDTVTGIGSVTVRQTPINGRPPGSQTLREDVNKGRGKPLSKVADRLREHSDHRPSVTMLAGPRDHVDDARHALESDAESVLSLCHDARRIDLVRFHLVTSEVDEDLLGLQPRTSVRSRDPAGDPPGESDGRFGASSLVTTVLDRGNS